MGPPEPSPYPPEGRHPQEVQPGAGFGKHMTSGLPGGFWNPRARSEPLLHPLLLLCDFREVSWTWPSSTERVAMEPVSQVRDMGSEFSLTPHRQGRADTWHSFNTRKSLSLDACAPEWTAHSGTEAEEVKASRKTDNGGPACAPSSPGDTP